MALVAELLLAALRGRLRPCLCANCTGAAARAQAHAPCLPCQPLKSGAPHMGTRPWSVYELFEFDDASLEQVWTSNFALYKL